ncbi:hypothetical protein [Muricoccus radiodurans]|uniref:hypothetical protein n=1 Tax=Muricoccus radiodurans TaxID=2231721 RepID=UPI003CEC09FB
MVVPAWTIDDPTALDNAVQKFKNTFSANLALITNGQFQIQNANFNAIWSQVQSEFGTAGIGQNDPIAVAFSAFMTSMSGSDRAAFEKLLKEPKMAAALPVTKKLFAPDGRASVVVASAFSATWTGGGIPAPVSTTNASVDQMIAGRAREASACFETSVALGSKLKTARGTGKVAGPHYASGQIASARLRNVPGGSRQEVVYDPKALADAVSKIAASVAAGQLYIFGVLSGDNHTNVGKKFPDPEHWLLVFDVVKGQFLFWDSDSSTTELSMYPSWGPGIGILFHKSDRFSTANGGSDFDAIQNNHHLHWSTRHAYQVYVARPLS